jgi:hypothetical protein
LCGNTFSDDTEVCRSQNSRKADYRNDEIKIRQSEWVSKMKQFIFFIAIFLHASFLISCSYDSPVSYDCDGTGVIYSLKELKIDKHTVPFKVSEGVYRLYEVERANKTKLRVRFDTVLLKLEIRNTGDPDAVVDLACTKK